MAQFDVPGIRDSWCTRSLSYVCFGRWWSSRKSWWGVHRLSCSISCKLPVVRDLTTDPIHWLTSSQSSVTAVGATVGTDPEVAADFSGGGFSNYFARQSYQSEAVSTFLDTLGTTYKGLYNVSGRAYPDVSAQGVNFTIIWYGAPTLISGTSASTPTFAAIIALLNDKLLAAGKSALGFLNPFLYSTGASAFTDIVSGNAEGCDTAGFSAVKGWDPVCKISVIALNSLSHSDNICIYIILRLRGWGRRGLLTFWRRWDCERRIME